MVVKKVKLPQISDLKPTRLFIILIIILILVTTSLTIGNIGNFSSEDEAVVAIATVDKTIARIASTFHFSSDESKGKIRHQIWTFGDGNNSGEMNPDHTYEFARLYNVTLTVFGSDEEKDTTTLQVGVQLEDYSIDLDIGRDRRRNRNGMSGSGIYGVLGPNCGNPIVTIHGTVSGAIGEFELEVSVEAEMLWLQVIYVEPIIALGETLQFDVIIPPEEIHEDAQYLSCLLKLILWTSTGRYGGIDLTMKVEFPMESIIL